MALTADFELGTAGQEVQTTDAGNASAWDFIDRDASIKYDTTHALGAQSALFHTTAGVGTARLRWTTSFGTQTEYYGRACIYRTANPPSDMLHMTHGRTGGTGYSWTLRISATGKIVVLDQGFSTLATSTASIPLNQWFRLEWHVNNTTGFIEVLLYDDATSETLTETVITGTPGGIGADTTFSDFGFSALSQDVWYDALVDAAASYPGPYAAASQILLASADSVDGSWTDQAGGTSLAAAIDEATADNADYIRSELSPSASGCRVKLASGTDPASSSDHTIKWRVGKNAAGGQTVNMTVKLYQGGGNSQGAGTLIASFSRNGVTDTITEYTETLSGAEADAITDYADLYLEFFANAT